MLTPSLKLPLMAAGQSQKHITHNDALVLLDDLVQLSVLTRTVASPPSNPAEGARYLLPVNAAGLWTGRSHQVAIWRDGGWSYHQPADGWRVFVQDEGLCLFFQSGNWSAVKALGVNTSADATNRFAVASDASLFTHAGSSHRLKINKSDAAATASMLFQSGYQGRAEIGLSGQDDLSFKVSADGSVWKDALVINAATGAVAFPAAGSVQDRQNLLINGDFAINQRAFSGGSLAANAFGFDRWRAGATGASLTLAGGILTLASGDISQAVEAAQWGLITFAGLVVTVSLEGPTADVRVRLGGIDTSIAAGTGRRSVSLTIPVGFLGVPVLVLSRLSAGQVSFSRVKLEVGGSATAWNPRALSAEETLAKRYFYRITGPFSLFLYAQSAGNYFFNSLPLAVTMRITPVVTRVLGTYGNIFQTDLANAAASALASSSIRLSVRANGAGECYANFERIDCDAELV
jgi:Protein of unknown function (DUF2793)